MLFLPIPLSELQHHIIIKTLVNQENKKEYVEYEVNNVALQRKTVRSLASNGEILYKSGWLLFVDNVNSKFESIDIFKEGSIVIYNGEEKVITTIEIIDPGNVLHHLEVSCV
jgi:hypothetical protein